MYVLVIVLNETNFLNDILAKFVDLGVKGATILDSQGMAGVIVDEEINDIPLFGALKNIIKGTGKYNKTIFTVLKNEELVERVVDAVQEVLNGDAKATTGFMFSVPVGKLYTFQNKRNF
jgi:nitrogen regulatory protein PII